MQQRSNAGTRALHIGGISNATRCHLPPAQEQLLCHAGWRTAGAPGPGTDARREGSLAAAVCPQEPAQCQQRRAGAPPPSHESLARHSVRSQDGGRQAGRQAAAAADPSLQTRPGPGGARSGSRQQGIRRSRPRLAQEHAAVASQGAAGCWRCLHTRRVRRRAPKKRKSENMASLFPCGSGCAFGSLSKDKERRSNRFLSSCEIAECLGLGLGIVACPGHADEQGLPPETVRGGPRTGSALWYAPLSPPTHRPPLPPCPPQRDAGALCV